MGNNQIVHDAFAEKPSLADLEHYGVLGMKWGVRKNPQRARDRAYDKLATLDRRVSKAENRVVKAKAKSLRKQERADTAILFKKWKARKAEDSIRRTNVEHIRLQRKVAKAEKWYKSMDKVFGGMKLSALKSEQKGLRRKYGEGKVNEMLDNAKTDASMRQLMMYYSQKGRR